MQRDKMIRVVVSDDEDAKAKELASAHGMTVSAYIRHLIVASPTPPPPNKPRRKVRRLHSRTA